MYKILITFLLILNFTAITYAFDVTELGDFSSRSVIINKMYGTDPVNQEQRDLLQSKKLTPTSACLFSQIKKGKIENVKLLLDSKVSPNQAYYSDYPIYYAAKNNRTEIVKLLYEYGAKLDRGFYSELYEALRHKNKDLAQFLLDRGAKVNYMDSLTNNTILYLALKNNMLDIASQLIAKGAKPDSKSIRIVKKKKLINLIESK